MNTITTMLKPDIWLEEICIKRGYGSLDDMARAIGIARSSIQKFKAGIAGPQICVDLAMALHTPVATVLAVQGIIPTPTIETQKRDEVVTLFTALPENEQKYLLDLLNWHVARATALTAA